MDETKVASELDRLAAEHEAKAAELRRAAQIVRGSSGSTTDPVAQRKFSSPVAKPSRRDYIDVIRAHPGTGWTPTTLASAMQDAGFETNEESSRTMLYRLERAGGVVAKQGRGQWQTVIQPANVDAASVGYAIAKPVFSAAEEEGASG